MNEDRGKLAVKPNQVAWTNAENAPGWLRESCILFG